MKRRQKATPMGHSEEQRAALDVAVVVETTPSRQHLHLRHLFPHLHLNLRHLKFEEKKKKEKEKKNHNKQSNKIKYNICKDKYFFIHEMFYFYVKVHK